MTIKKLKEKINENPNKLNAIEKDLVVQMGLLKLFDEDLRVEKVIQNHFIKVEVINTLINIYKRYDDSFIEEVQKFIDFASKQLPNYTFDYKVIDKQNIEIDCIHISNNMLECKTIYCTKNDYNTYTT